MHIASPVAGIPHNGAPPRPTAGSPTVEASARTATDVQERLTELRLTSLNAGGVAGVAASIHKLIATVARRVGS